MPDITEPKTAAEAETANTPASAVSRLKDAASRVVRFLLPFMKLFAVAIVIGLIGGLVGAAFHGAVAYAGERFGEHRFWLWLLPVAGLIIVAVYRGSRVGESTGTDTILSSVRLENDVPFLLAPVIFVSTFLTHLCGGSAGREGAAVQLGGTVGIKLGKLFRLGKKELPIAVMCGIAGVFSAVFGTPLTAALFTVEVVTVGQYYWGALVPCLVSALTAYKIALLCGLESVAFAVPAAPQMSAINLLRVIALAALCAVVSILFCGSMHLSARLQKKLFKNPYLRVAAGGLAIIGLTYLFGYGTYNGAGMSGIAAAIGGTADWESFLIKMLFTAITIGAGYRGGEIVPSFFVGATFGCVMGNLLGLEPGFAAALGLVCVFCGAVNCPIASVFLGIELFGGNGILYLALACAVCYALSGYGGLYHTQRIVYSKVLAEYIGNNKHEA